MLQTLFIPRKSIVDALQNSLKANMNNLNNFDALRLLAAASVIFSHSFLIAEGSEDNEPLQALTGEILGIYGVFVFFIISGYFITRSRMHTPTIKQYLQKRFLRIFPGYAASILVTVVLLCPLFSDQSIIKFLTDENTWVSVGKTLLFMNRSTGDSLMINGFSFYSTGVGGSMGTVINGVFWTLKIEIILYLAVAVLFRFGLLNPWVTALLSSFWTVAFFMDWYRVGNLFGIHLGFGVPGFFAGSLLYFLFEKYGAKTEIAIFFVLSIVFASYIGVIDKLFPILAAYPILYLGSSQAPSLGNWRRFGDLSYGIYIYGWPIQQVFRAVLGDSWCGWSFFLFCMPVVALIGWLSWKFVEEPALRYKKIRSRGVATSEKKFRKNRVRFD